MFVACWFHADMMRWPRAELLTQASRVILGEMVSLIFVRLGEMPETALTPTTARSLAASRPLSPAPSALPSATPMLAGPGAYVAWCLLIISTSSLATHGAACPCSPEHWIWRAVRNWTPWRPAKVILEFVALMVLKRHVLAGALEPARNAEPGAAAPAEGGAAPAENGIVSGPPANAAAGLPWAVLLALDCMSHAGSHMNRVRGVCLSGCGNVAWRFLGSLSLQLLLPCVRRTHAD